MPEVVETANGAAATNGEEKPKPKRGKPKDEHAPPRPKSGFTKFGIEARPRLKEQRPELITDLSGMGKAIAEEWAKVPEAEKEKMQKEYDAEMAIWKPKWEAYKQTPHYKEFFEIRQDWIDKRNRKKLQKKMNANAPKRPRSGYMIFSGEIREEVMAKVKAEGLGMGDGGRIISERWNALSEDKKAQYAEESQNQKKKFDVEFEVYRKSQDFKDYMDAKANQEGTQDLNKVKRTHLGDAPKRPPSGVGMFKKEHAKKVMEENKGMKMSELSKKLNEMWQALGADKQKAYNEEAEKKKAEWEDATTNFKCTQLYTDFFVKREKVRTRQNRMLNLRETPKRGKTAFALYCDRHKDEVEPGKGEGKGRSALKVKFASVSQQEKEELERLEKENKEAYEKELAAFKESDRFKNFQTMKAKIEEEYKKEAMKITTLRFLREAPNPPPKTGFLIYFQEKEQQAGEDGPPKKKSKEEKKEFLQKTRSEFLALPQEVRKEFDRRTKEKAKEFEEEVKEFMKTERWQAYIAEAKKLRIPVQKLIGHKKVAIKKLNKNMPPPVAMPSKPDTWPEKSPSAMQIFSMEKRKEGLSLVAITQQWAEMGADVKAKYVEASVEKKKQYEAEVVAFRKSPEGSKYFRDLRSAQRRKKVTIAKFKWLKDQPKKPKAAVFGFMEAKRSDVQREFPDLKGKALNPKLMEKWSQLTEEERKPWQEKAAQAQEEFRTQTQEFKSSDNWKMYVKATAVFKPKAKAKGKGATSAPKKPANMPSPPLGAFRNFCKQRADAGQAQSLPELQRQFSSLPEDEKKALEQQAAEETAKYKEDLAAFEASAVGKKYHRDVANFKKKGVLANAKNKFCKNEPKKPLSAYFIFLGEKREELAAQGIRSIGDVSRKAMELWKALDEEGKAEYNNKAKEKQEAYEEEMKEWKNSDNYKKYMRIVQQAMGGPKAKGKGKPPPTGPAKPANLPKKPPTGFFMYMEEQKQGGSVGTSQVQDSWMKLGAEGQKAYNDKSAEATRQYDVECRAFMKTAEGKRYHRELAAFQKKQKEGNLKRKFLEGMEEPKRPQSAYFIFVGETRPKLESGLSMGEASRKMTSMWNELTPEGKKEFENKAAELKKEYDQKMEEYRNSANYKKYARAMQGISKQGAAKAKAKAHARGNVRPQAKKAAGKKGASDSDSDVMGSDTDSSSSASSDSD